MDKNEKYVLLGHTYQVIEDLGVADAGRVGEAHLLRGKILIAPDLTPELRFATKMHEFQHVLLSHSGVKEHSETHIDVFVNNLVPTFMYNHDLMTELIELTGYAASPISRKRK